MTTNPWITKLKFSFQDYQWVPQWKQLTETHHSQEVIICKLPRQPLLFNELGCSVKDKHAGRHRCVFTSSKLLYSFLYRQNTQTPSPASQTFQARNDCLGLGRCCTPATSCRILSGTMRFLNDMCICCLRDCPKLQPKLPQDTYLLGELASVWISTYVPQGGNVELNKLRAELHRGRAALTAVTSPLSPSQPGPFSPLLKGCHFWYCSVALARSPSHCIHLGHLKAGSKSHCLQDKKLCEDLRKEQSCVTRNESGSLCSLLLPFSLTLPLESRDRGSIPALCKICSLRSSFQTKTHIHSLPCPAARAVL